MNSEYRTNGILDPLMLNPVLKLHVFCIYSKIKLPFMSVVFQIPQKEMVKGSLGEAGTVLC